MVKAFFPAFKSGSIVCVEQSISESFTPSETLTFLYLLIIYKKNFSKVLNFGKVQSVFFISSVYFFLPTVCASTTSCVSFNFKAFFITSASYQALTTVAKPSEVQKR